MDLTISVEVKTTLNNALDEARREIAGGGGRAGVGGGGGSGRELSENSPPNCGRSRMSYPSSKSCMRRDTLLSVRLSRRVSPVVVKTTRTRATIRTTLTWIIRRRRVIVPYVRRRLTTVVVVVVVVSSPSRGAASVDALVLRGARSISGVVSADGRSARSRRKWRSRPRPLTNERRARRVNHGAAG